MVLLILRRAILLDGGCAVLLLLTKIFVTVLVILALTAIAEHASPGLAGIFSGYPIGTAIVLYFYGLEYGADFAAISAAYNLVGLIPTLTFACCYLLVIRRCGECSPVAPTLVAISGYLIVALILGQFSYGVGVSVFLVIAAISLAWYISYNREEVVSSPPASYSPRVMFVRMIMAAGLVVIITSLAGVVGARWAGILSAFPLVLYPLILMIHLRYGATYVRPILGHFPGGLWSVLSYSLTVLHVYPTYGLGVGTVMGFAVATTCLLVCNFRGFVHLWGSVQRP